MKYVSTRDKSLEKKTFSEVLLKGLADDGGLYVPDRYSQFSPKQLKVMRKMPYSGVALSVLSRFVGDSIPELDLQKMVLGIYNKEVFGSEKVTPLIPIGEDIYVQELFNGPSLAFKDIALQFLGAGMEYLLNEQNSRLNILGASSGDTVSAAEEAVKGKKNVNIFMLTPKTGMSPFQKSQAGIISAQYSNVHNISLEAPFDTCQDIVKEVNSDLDFKNNNNIGAVNSINWARIAAQVGYTFYGYNAVARNIGDPVDISVPSGNFGDALSVHIAKMMGVPIRKIIVATNENLVLDNFFKTGVYEQIPSEVTSSPSMDISKASNLERLLFDSTGGRSEVLIQMMREFNDYGIVSITPGQFDFISGNGFVSGNSTHADRIDTINGVHKQEGYIVDPHTADGIKVGLEYKEDNVPLICFGTASPIKFEDTIKEAIGYVPKRPANLANLEQQEQKFVDLPARADLIKDYIINNS